MEKIDPDYVDQFQWDTDFTMADGCQRFMAAINDVKEMAAMM